MAQVTQLSEDKDVRTVRKYFKRLLVDRKNFEYQDKIHYEMGLFEQKHSNLDGAIDNFKTSVKVSQGNNRQKGMSYLSLGKIYYDSLKNFELAKSYYDSAVTALPKDEDNYQSIKTRQEVLAEFVEHITTIRVNDSLISLSRLPADSLQRFVESKVTQDSIKTADIRERKAEQARNEQQRLNNTRDDEGTLINTGGGTWYFANSSSVSRGHTAFKRKWKNRELEDNWRISVKTSTTQEVAENSSQISSQNELSAETSESNSEKSRALLATIPKTDEAHEKLLKEVEEALYQVGNIYNFKLLEKDNSILTFMSLLDRFPDTTYEPEVLYQLYLLQQESNPTASKIVADRLLEEHPETVYANLILNPNYREENFAATIQLQATYKRAYALYEEQEFGLSLSLLDSALAIHPQNEFSDNLYMLRIMAVGQLEGQHKYQFELDNFVRTYSESELLPYAQTLIEKSSDFKANLYSSSKAKYVLDFNQEHSLVIIYSSADDNSTKVTEMMQEFVDKKDLASKFGTLLLSDEYTLSVIDEITSKQEAKALLTSFNTEMNPVERLEGAKHYIFVITEENFSILYSSKDIDTYQTFFEKHYK